MDNSNAIINARIDDTMLGFEGHGIMTAWLHLDLDGGGISLGGWNLNGGDSLNIFVKNVLETVGVEKWEELKGKHIRIEFNGPNSWGSKIIAIGNIMQDKWFNPTKVFEVMKKEN